MLKEVADRRLLLQASPRGLNASLTLCSLTLAVVMATAIWVGSYTQIPCGVDHDVTVLKHSTMILEGGMHVLQAKQSDEP